MSFIIYVVVRRAICDWRCIDFGQLAQVENAVLFDAWNSDRIHGRRRGGSGGARTPLGF